MKYFIYIAALCVCSTYTWSSDLELPDSTIGIMKAGGTLKTPRVLDSINSPLVNVDVEDIILMFKCITYNYINDPLKRMKFIESLSSTISSFKTYRKKTSKKTEKRELYKEKLGQYLQNSESCSDALFSYIANKLSIDNFGNIDLLATEMTKEESIRFLVDINFTNNTYSNMCTQDSTSDSKKRKRKSQPRKASKITDVTNTLTSNTQVTSKVRLDSKSIRTNKIKTKAKKKKNKTKKRVKSPLTQKPEVTQLISKRKNSAKTPRSTNRSSFKENSQKKDIPGKLISDLLDTSQKKKPRVSSPVRPSSHKNQHRKAPHILRSDSQKIIISNRNHKNFKNPQRRYSDNFSKFSRRKSSGQTKEIKDLKNTIARISDNFDNIVADDSKHLATAFGLVSHLLKPLEDPEIQKILQNKPHDEHNPSCYCYSCLSKLFPISFPKENL